MGKFYEFYLLELITEENLEMANKHMKSCSTSLVISRIPIETDKYHCTPTVLTIPSFVKVVGTAGTFLHY